MSMSFFGALDATALPEVPEDGTHPMTLRSWRTHHSAAGNDFLVFEFIMDHPYFPNEPVKMWLQFYPDLTKDLLEEMDDTERARVIRNVNNLKNFFRSLGMPEDEIDNPDLDEYVGVEGMGYGTSRDRRDGKGKEWNLRRFAKN